MNHTIFDLVGRYMYRCYTNYWIIVGRLINKQMYYLVNILNKHTFTRDTIEEAMSTIKVRSEIDLRKVYEVILEGEIEPIHMIYNINYNNALVVEKTKTWNILLAQKLNIFDEKRLKMKIKPNDPNILSACMLEGEEKLKEHISTLENQAMCVFAILFGDIPSYSQEVLSMTNSSYMLFRQSWMTLEQKLKCIKATVRPINEYMKGIFFVIDEFVAISSLVVYFMLVGCSDDALIMLGSCYDQVFNVLITKEKMRLSKLRVIKRYVTINLLTDQLFNFIEDNFNTANMNNPLIMVAKMIDSERVLCLLSSMNYDNHNNEHDEEGEHNQYDEHNEYDEYNEYDDHDEHNEEDIEI